MTTDTEDEMMPSLPTGSTASTSTGRVRRLRNRTVLADEEDSDNDSSGSGPIAGPSRRRTVPVAKLDLASESSEWESDWNSSEEQLLEKGDKDAVAAVLASKLGYASDESSGSSSSSECEKCPICLLSLHNQEVGVPEVCEHVFCAPCIEEWSRNVSTCPIDRKGFELINIFRDADQRQTVLRVYRVQPKPVECEEEGGQEVGIAGTGAVPPEADELTYCEVCRQAHSEETMLLCDSCNLGYHMECLNPPLLEIPSGSWYCDCCFASGSDEDDNELQDLLNDLNEIGGMRESRLRQRIHSPARIVRTRQSERIRAAILNRAAAVNRLNNVQSSPDAAGPSTVATARTRRLAAGSSAHGGSSSSSSLVAVTAAPRTRKTVKRKRRRRTRRKILSMIISEYDVGDNDNGTGEGQKFAIKRKKLYSTLRKLRKKRAKRRKSASTSIMGNRRRMAGAMGAAIGVDGEVIRATNTADDVIQRQRASFGITPLKIFGGRNDLDYFSDDDDEEEGSSTGGGGLGGGGSTLVASGSMGPRLRNVLGRRRVLKSGFECFSTPSPSAAGTTSADLLGSILENQERWHSRNGLRNVRIHGGRIIFPPGTSNDRRRPTGSSNGVSQRIARDSVSESVTSAANTTVGTGSSTSTQPMAGTASAAGSSGGTASTTSSSSLAVNGTGGGRGGASEGGAGDSSTRSDTGGGDDGRDSSGLPGPSDTSMLSDHPVSSKQLTARKENYPEDGVPGDVDERRREQHKSNKTAPTAGRLPKGLAHDTQKDAAPSTSSSSASASTALENNCPNFSVYSSETLQYAKGGDGSQPYDPLDSEQRTDDEAEAEDDRFAGERDEDLVQLDDDDIDGEPIYATMAGDGHGAPKEVGQTTTPNSHENTTNGAEQVRTGRIKESQAKYHNDDDEEDEEDEDEEDEDDGTPARDEFDSESDDELKKIEADSSRGPDGRSRAAGGGLDALTPPLTTSLVAALGASGAAMAAASAMATANFGAPCAMGGVGGSGAVAAAAAAAAASAAASSLGGAEDDRSYTPCLDEKYQERRDLIDAGEGTSGCGMLLLSSARYRSEGSALDSAGIDGMDTELISEDEEGNAFPEESMDGSRAVASSSKAPPSGAKRKELTFKKVTKRGRERNYREKEKDRDGKKRSSGRDDHQHRRGGADVSDDNQEQESGGEGGKSTADRRNRQRRPKRKELPRYDIRSIIAEKRPRIYKDPFGRDITPKRRSRTRTPSRSRSRDRRRDVSISLSPEPVAVARSRSNFPSRRRSVSPPPLRYGRGRSPAGARSPLPFRGRSSSRSRSRGGAGGGVGGIAGRLGPLAMRSPSPRSPPIRGRYARSPRSRSRSPSRGPRSRSPSPPNAHRPMGRRGSLRRSVSRSRSHSHSRTPPTGADRRIARSKKKAKRKNKRLVSLSRSRSRSRSRSPGVRGGRSRGHKLPAGSGARKKKLKRRSISPLPAVVSKKQKKRKDRKRASLSPILSQSRSRSRTPVASSRMAAAGMLTERFTKGHHQRSRDSWTPPTASLPKTNGTGTSAAAAASLTVILTNEEALAKQQQDGLSGKDRGRSKQARKEARRREREARGKKNTLPSKEVFTSGDNILVSVSFNDKSKDAAAATAGAIGGGGGGGGLGKTSSGAGTGGSSELGHHSRHHHHHHHHHHSSERLTSKQQRQKEAPSSSSTSKRQRGGAGDRVSMGVVGADTERPKTKRLESRLKQRAQRSAAGDAPGPKPVVIIDLDGSPFRVITPSPKAVIVLSDSDTEKDKENRGRTGTGGPATAGGGGSNAAGTAPPGQTLPDKESNATAVLRAVGGPGTSLGQSLGLLGEGGSLTGVNGAAAAGSGGTVGASSTSTVAASGAGPVVRKSPPEVARRPSPDEDMFGPKTPPGFPTGGGSVGAVGGACGGQLSSKTIQQAPKFSMQVKTKSSNLRPVNALYDPGDLDDGKDNSSDCQDAAAGAGESGTAGGVTGGPSVQTGSGMGYGIGLLSAGTAGVGGSGGVGGGSGAGQLATAVGPNTPPEPAPQSPSPDVYDPFEPTKSPSPSPTSGAIAGRDRSDAIGRLADMMLMDDEQDKAATGGGAAVAGDGVDSAVGGAASNEIMNGGPGADSALSRTPPQPNMVVRNNSGPGANAANKVTVLSNLVLGVSATATNNATTVDVSGANSDSDVVFDDFMPTSAGVGAAVGSSLISKLPLPGSSVGPGAGGGGAPPTSAPQNNKFAGDFLNPTDSPYSPGASDFDDLFEPPGGGGSGDLLDSSPLQHTGGKQLSNNGHQQQPNSQQLSYKPASSKPMPPTKAAKKSTNQFDSLFGSSPNQAHNNIAGANSRGTNRRDRRGQQKRTKGGKPNQKPEAGDDDDPSKLSGQEKFLKKLNRLERVVEEVKLVIKPYYNKKQINKDEYKDILRRAVPKICHSRTGEINPIKIQKLIKAYVRKIRGKRRLNKKGPGVGGGPGTNNIL